MTNWPSLTIEQKHYLIQSVWREEISATEIAAAIGVSKGTIIGYYGRNKAALSDTPLSSRKGKQKTNAPRKSRAKSPEEKERDRLARMELPKPVSIVPHVHGLYVLLEDCDGCTWPLNDGGPYLFCGHAKFGKYAYCEHHHERSRGRGTISERSAHRVSELHASS